MTKDNIDEWIHGEEVPLTSWFACEGCAGVYFAVTELGFFVTLPADFRAIVREYNEFQKVSNNEEEQEYHCTKA